MDYDDLIVTEALGVEVLLSANGKGGFGIAQKIVNLFIKDLWGFGVIGMPSEEHLHAPVDRRVLGKFSNVPRDWIPWTKVLAGSPSCATITSYLGIQKQLRDLWMASPIRFPSVIQMEQFLWHQIP